jgi:hypothetical protein
MWSVPKPAYDLATMRAVALAFPALLLGACTVQLHVPPVDGVALAGTGARQPGRYAALVQTGGWNMIVEEAGLGAVLPSKVDLNPTWEKAMREALTAALEKVDFVTNAQPSAELAKQGYDAQIAIMQSNGTSNVESFQTEAYGGPRVMVSVTSLDGILTISYPDGTVQQQAVHGLGSGQRLYWSDEAIADAGAAAVRHIVEQATAATKLLLAQRTQH